MSSSKIDADDQRKHLLLQRRSYLEKASVAPLLASVLKSTISGRLRGSESESEGPVLLPHYVFGYLLSATQDQLTIDAPTRAGNVTVSLRCSGHTELSHLNPSIAFQELEVGSRIRAVTLLIGDDQTERVALSVTVNVSNMHGEVQDIDQKAQTLTVLHAHSETPVSVSLTDSTDIWVATGRIDCDALFRRLQPSEHVFLSGYTEKPELPPAIIHAFRFEASHSSDLSAST